MNIPTLPLLYWTLFLYLLIAYQRVKKNPRLSTVFICLLYLPFVCFMIYILCFAINCMIGGIPGYLISAAAVLLLDKIYTSISADLDFFAQGIANFIRNQNQPRQ